MDNYKFNSHKVYPDYKLESTKTFNQMGQGSTETKVYCIKQHYIFGLSFEKSGSQTISISFNDRSFADKSRNIKYSSCRFIVAKAVNDYDTTDGVQYKQGMYEHWERDYYIECDHLEQGKYFVFVEIDWHESL